MLTAQSSKANGKADAPATPEHWLTVPQVVAQFGLTKRWIYRHKGQLPHSSPSRKVLLFHEEKLKKWLAAHTAG
jgi:predicted DNA-binding transcriptional regulator AlpA